MDHFEISITIALKGA